MRDGGGGDFAVGGGGGGGGGGWVNRGALSRGVVSCEGGEGACAWSGRTKGQACIALEGVVVFRGRRGLGVILFEGCESSRV
eukprot:SAG11_NODE_236_length_11840_cov_6.566051_6_plen_82_part_00